MAPPEVDDGPPLEDVLNPFIEHVVLALFRDDASVVTRLKSFVNNWKREGYSNAKIFDEVCDMWHGPRVSGPAPFFHWRARA